MNNNYYAKQAAKQYALCMELDDPYAANAAFNEYRTYESMIKENKNG